MRIRQVISGIFVIPLTDGTGYLELATTRPETLLGDTAVAVNPNDEQIQGFSRKNIDTSTCWQRDSNCCR